MSTIVVASIIISLLVLFIVLFTRNEQKKKRNGRNQFLSHFSELGLRNNLSFSGQEILKDAAIGLDGLHRKLLVLTRNGDGKFSNRLIDLDSVKTCLVKKQYSTIYAGSKKNPIEHYVEKIVLRFEFRNNQEPVNVFFYHHISSDVYEIKEMSEKAKHWEIILSKMLKSTPTERAKQQSV